MVQEAVTVPALTPLLWLTGKLSPGSPSHSWKSLCPHSEWAARSFLLTRNGVDLVQDHEAPLLSSEPLHDALRLPGPLGGMAQHGVGANGNGAADGLVLGIGGEAADLAIVDGGPHLELGFPLLHRHSGVAQHQTALSDSAGSCHANQGLPSTYEKPENKSTQGQAETRDTDRQTREHTDLGKLFLPVFTADIGKH